MSNNFNTKEELPGKVKIVRFENGIEISSDENEYIEKKPRSKPLDCIKRLSKKQRQKLDGKKKKKRRMASSDKSFYKSREWLELRYRVLKTYRAKCMCCGKNPREHGIVLHVDHIKPRSKFPKLELNFDNMQVLCAACNVGKSNIDNTDWRALSNNDLYLMKIAQKMN